MPGLLTELADRARVRSITASSAIAGVVVADASRAERIINRRTSMLRNRSEQELAGYRDAQDYLFHQDWRPLNAGLILHLRRLLFAHTAMPRGASPSSASVRTVRPRPSRHLPLRGWQRMSGSPAHQRHAQRARLHSRPLREPRATRRRIGRRRLADIRTAVPGVSDQTIRLVLAQLRNEGRVRVNGTGRSATWTRIPSTAPSE